LPVLRAALGDPSFFSSRRHPVRRIVNRIASLGAAFEDFSEADAQQFLARVRQLVQEVVEGDFDQIELYEQKLAALEQFVDAQGKAAVNAPAAALLAAKEDELRLAGVYAQQLESDLKGLSVPAFVREFIADVWSRVLLAAAGGEPDGGVRLKRLRQVARDLFMSVQPKTSPAARKTFLAELPKLMQGLNEGMDLIGWPDAERRSFFGALLPAHAESLKAQPLSPLDFNLLARQVEGALDKPLPTPEQLRAVPVAPPPADAAPRFTPEEAAQVGLLDEAAIDWDGKVDIDLGADEPVGAADLAIEGLASPAPDDAPEPSAGKSLADHVQIGFAYQMHLEGEWHRVRLSHVSPGRTFFVFTRGQKHKRTISLTYRMLARLCESGRLRAYENAYLLERATARARRQLEALHAAPAANAAATGARL
jgi:hypothetical protein